MSARMCRRAGALVAAVFLVLVATPARAHVLLDAVRPRGGGVVELVFSFDHGCSGREPTDELTLTAPDHTVLLGAQEPPGWSHRIEAGTIVWTGPGIPDGERAEFVVTARVGASAGETVLFPVRQACEGAEPYAWAGTADDDPQPAPRFVATGATVDPALLPTPPTATSRGAGPVAVGAAILALTGAAAAATWVVRRRDPTT